MGAEPRTHPDPRAELLAGIPWEGRPTQKAAALAVLLAEMDGRLPVRLDPDPLAVTEDDLVERLEPEPMDRHPGRWVLEYDAQYRWLVVTGPGGASAIVADHVSPWRAHVALAKWSAVRLLSRLVAKVKGWLGR